MVPLQIGKFRLTRPSAADVRWLEATVARISAGFGSTIDLAGDGSLLLRWQGAVGSSDRGVEDDRAR
jgi:hypothetical protein